MALIFEDNGDNAPRTHALIIGVGGYRHLSGGSAEVPQTMEHVGLLKQLTSPPRSAVAFAQFLVESGDHWMAPLGSVDLLVSTASNDSDALPSGLQATPATMANIQQAYNDWKERCNRNPDNIAIFYFCGHGVEKNDLHLLAEDFGTNPNNPWLGSFTFNVTRLAFHACRAKTQCFFVDACREITSGMLTRIPTEIPLDIPDITKSQCEFNLTILGAARNEAALGPRQGISYFTQALMRALQGAVASIPNEEEGWVIETGEVAKHITDVLRMVKPEEGFKQRCDPYAPRNTTILRVPPPKVTVVLECIPPEANPVAHLSCNTVSSPVKFKKHHQGAPWSLEIEAGHYKAVARFHQAGGFHAASQIFFVRPFYIPAKLKCDL